jgi:diguanylate cyclase (GGDEF)-like protein
VLSTVVGVALVALGTSVLVGWFGGFETLTRVRGGLASMKFNTALGFVLLGAANLAGAARRPRTTFVVAVVVVLLGLLTLMQYVAGVDLRIDTLFWKTRVPAGPVLAYPGRMGPNTAVAFVLSGLAVAWGARAHRAIDPVVVGCLGAAVLAISSVSTVGYATGLSHAHTWGLFNPMAIHTSAAFMLQGGLLMGVGAVWSGTSAQRRRWIILPAGIALGLCALLFWMALDAQREDASRRSVDEALAAARAGILDRLEYHVSALRRMAERWERRGGVPEAEWSSDAENYLRDFGDYRAIVLLDSSFTPRWSEPRDALRMPARDPPIRDERHERLFLVAAPEARHKELLVSVPIVVSGHFEGAVQGIINLRSLFAAALAPAVVRGHGVRVVSGGEALYQRDMQVDSFQKAAATEIGRGGLALQLTLAPTPALEASQWSPLGAIALLAWALLTAVALLAFRLAETARMRAAELLHQRELVRAQTIELQRSNAELERSRETLQELASRDDMTGLLNRRELGRLFGEEASRAERAARPVSLLLIDIDHFKGVNDQYGHGAGDQVIKHVAGILLSTLRLVDKAARIGGEEFAILLPETNGADATKVAERLRKLVMAFPCPVVDGQGVERRIEVMVSIGVASAQESVGSLPEILARADLCLYRAKAQGRNRVVAAA